MRTYELKLATGKTVVWSGDSGEDAARRYVDHHRKDAVVAWRDYPRTGVFPGMANIIEPGDKV